MKRKNRGKISHVSTDLRPLIRTMGRNKPGFHTEIWARWADIVGPALAKRFWPINFYKGTLVAAVTNSAWMQELTYLRPTLLDRFAEEIGPTVVRDIRLILNTHMKIPGESQTPKKTPHDDTPVTLPPEIETATSKIVDSDLREAARKAAAAMFRRDQQRNKT